MLALIIKIYHNARSSECQIISKDKKGFRQVNQTLQLKQNRQKLLTVRCGNTVGYERNRKEAEKNLKYKNLSIEIQGM